MSREFTHIDEKGNPAMVNVSDKSETRRTAVAEARVFLPSEVLSRLEANEIKVSKGPVFQTAIIAGIMAAKKTGELIPLCHPLGLDHVEINMRAEGDEVVIRCTASVMAKTGVEMEALTGAALSALTIYDMCKGISHRIVIRNIRLVEKTGGKNDFHAK